MKNIIVVLGVLALNLAACSSGSGDPLGAAAQTVVLDVRCTDDADCPSGFECEDEVEHGTATSYCVSHDSDDAAAGQCPAGFELEEEHSETFCKPHGGGGKDDASSGGGDVSEGQACATDADCAAGLECEVETEGGVTTSTCKPHG